MKRISFLCLSVGYFFFWSNIVIVSCKAAVVEDVGKLSNQDNSRDDYCHSDTLATSALDIIHTYFVNNLMWQEALPIFFILFILFLIGLYYSSLFLKCSACIGLLFIGYFFRNPERVCRESLIDPACIVCPADGKVVGIESIENDPFFDKKVAIFLSPFDVHVQWTPYAGIVKDTVYHKGEFAPAFLPKSSLLNERNDVIIQTARGYLLKVRQIAGTIARTIVCWVNPNETLLSNQKFGMIKFGSRVELFLPKEAKIIVSENTYVFGGQTVIARWEIS